MAKSKDVVTQALKDSQQNKMESVYGITINLFKVSARLIPHRLILRDFDGIKYIIYLSVYT